MAAVLLGVRALVSQGPPTNQPDPTQPAGILLVFGTIGACGIGAISSWTAMSPVSIYRKGGLSMVTAFATFVMALLLAPVNQFAGPAGVAVVAVLAGFGAWSLGRRISRIRAGL